MPLTQLALLIPIMALEAGGALRLRRLQYIISYGESPPIFALTILPLAVLAFDRALRTKSNGWSILAGGLSPTIVLRNAFGAAALAASVVSLLAINESQPW